MGARARSASVFTCLALVASSGCGDDDSGTSPTAAEYRDEGNALCKKAVREVEAIPAPTSAEGIADYLETIFDASEKMTEEFVDLDPPEELRADHERAVELSRESEKTFDEIVERVRDASNPQAAVQREFRKLAPELAQAEKLNTRLGLDECNETGPPSEQPAPS